MRLGVLADVHGNLPALEAVLEAMDGVDGWLCAGDLVGYGPFPNECVERVAALGGACVAGNHDLIALGRLDDERCIAVAKETLRWTSEVLAGDARGFLEALPLVARPATGLAVAHGSPEDPEDYVRTAARAREVLVGGVLVLGHTHDPWAFGARAGSMLRGDETGTVAAGDGEAWLLNPGSVGQSRTRDPRARALILDLERREARFLAVEYDVEKTREALRSHGLPPDACHLPPRSFARRVAARLVRPHPH